MGYIVVIALIVVVVPLLVLALSRNTTSVGPGERKSGSIVTEPSADQPTPRADAVNQAKAGAEKRLPPG